MACSKCRRHGHVASKHEERCRVCGVLNVVRDDTSEVKEDWKRDNAVEHERIRGGFGNEALIRRADPPVIARKKSA